MGIVDCFYHSFPIFLKNHKPEYSNISTVATASKIRKKVNLASSKTSISICTCSKSVAILMGAAGMTLISFVGSSHAADSLILNEPSNALSLPTWAVHVSSVVEWATAMALVWQYGDKPGYESWKGLSWGMVPLLGGALCACTWHFFYNSESLEVLVALQAALTVIGNATMCIAAYRIYTSFQNRPKDL